jgi:hypothetical protein
MPDSIGPDRGPADHGFKVCTRDCDVLDREATGRVRCIGCGKFVAARRRWNQCPDCDVREPEEKR